MGREKVEALLHAGQHAKGEHVDLHELQRVDVVLVPFDHLAVPHRRRLDRHEVVEPIAGQDKAARMLAEVPGGAHQLVGELEGQAQPAIGRVEVQVSKMVGADQLLRPGPDLRREGAEQVLGDPERLADVAQRALRTVADHGGAEGGVVAAVGVEHPLHDDLAALVLEVDVDVGWLAALLRHEALEEEVVAGRDRSR